MSPGVSFLFLQAVSVLSPHLQCSLPAFSPALYMTPPVMLSSRLPSPRPVSVRYGLGMLYGPPHRAPGAPQCRANDAHYRQRAAGMGAARWDGALPGPADEAGNTAGIGTTTDKPHPSAPCGGTIGI